jgi:CubicO group peptidase (beta-lactamase class C family)
VRGDVGARLAELLVEQRVPGAVVGVVDADRATRILVGGSRGNGLGPVNEGTVFHAASLSKPVFATGVMSLVDRGTLDLDRPLIEYVAEPYLTDDTRAASITARMVLSHTTGFPNWREDAPLFLRWAPGTRWGYSGEGFAYLQQVVEHLTGERLDRFMDDAVLRPLGMDDSHFGGRDTDLVRVAVGHDLDGNPRPRSAAPRTKAAAGGLYTTGPDYLRFLVHSLAHCSRMFAAQVEIDDGLAWGLGWGIETSGGEHAIWQWGNDPGYKNFVIARPVMGDGVVVFTNGDRGALVYREIVRDLAPGPHPSLDPAHRLRWLLAKATRPVDLRARLDEPAVRELLAAAGSRGEVDELFGLVVEKSWEAQGVAPGTPIACIGVQRDGDTAVITALAVLPAWRGQGFARALIYDVCDYLALRVVEAEIDADSVGFFRAVGFAVERVGAGFRCRLELPRIDS